MQCAGSIRVLGTKRFLSHSEGPLVKGFGLRIPALTTVELCQDVKAGCDSRMHRLQHSLADDQGRSQEGLGLSVLSTLEQVGARPVEQLRCFWKCHSPLFYQGSTHLRLREIALAARPCRELNDGKHTIDGSNRSLGPCTLCMIVHAIPENGLHQAVDAKHFRKWIAPYQRELLERFNGLVQLERIGGNRGEHRTKFSSSFNDDLFGNSIGAEKGAEAQQISGSRIGLFYLLKRERPGCGYGCRMICRKAAAALQEFLAARGVEVEVTRQTAPGLFDVGSCLVKREGQTIHYPDNGFSSGLVFPVRLAGRCRGGKQFCTAQEQQRSFFLVHSLQVDAVGESACRMSASGQEDMPVTPGRQKIKYQVKVIGVIENQQPAHVVNQPLLDG